MDSDSDSKHNGYIALCRTCSHCIDLESDPYYLFLCRTGIWVGVCLRQCKWAIRMNMSTSNPAASNRWNTTINVIVTMATYNKKDQPWQCKIFLGNAPELNKSNHLWDPNINWKSQQIVFCHTVYLWLINTAGPGFPLGLQTKRIQNFLLQGVKIRFPSQQEWGSNWDRNRNRHL